jgi:hypothetical protein
VSVQFKSGSAELTLERQLIDQAPIPGRNPYNLSNVDPTIVVSPGTNENRPYHHAYANDYDAGGGTRRGNDVLLDGVPLVASYKTAYTPAVDAGEEITVCERNKIFSFTSFEQWDDRRPLSIVRTVPTEAERRGDFSQSVLNGRVRTIYNPFTSTVDPTSRLVVRQPFEGNRIPSTMIDPAALKMLNEIPLPNLPGNVDNWQGAVYDITDYWNLSQRVDVNCGRYRLGDVEKDDAERARQLLQHDRRIRELSVE